MATKFYLHATTTGLPSGTLPTDEQSTLTPDSNDFEGSRTTNRVMDTTIGVSQANLTNTSTADTNAHNYYVSRWVSPLLYQSRINANTWTQEYAAKEANATANFPRSSTGAMYVNCYVWNRSTGTKVGTILDGNSNADGEEAGTTQTVINFTFAGAAVTGIVPGECVLVLEIWAQVTQGNGTARVQDVYYDGTTENSTTNEAAFLSTPENLEFAQNVTARNATLVTSCRGVASTANTTQYWNVVGRQFVTTTENDSKVRFRTSGTLKKLSILLTANTVTGSTTFTVRKGGVDTSLVATASTTGAQYVEDLTNTVSISAGDDINLKTIPGAATNTFTIAYVSIVFEPTTATDTVSIMALSDAITVNTASTTIYFNPSGSSSGTSTVEARHKIKQKAAGTYSKLYVWVQSNARTTNTIFKSRKNGADGNLTVTYASGETGLKEDTSHSDTIAVDDDFNFACTTSTGTENIIFTIMKVEFTSTEGIGILSTGAGGGNAVAAAATTHYKQGGELANQGTESNIQFRNRLTYTKFSNMVVNVQDNTITGNSTIKNRVNATNGNLTLTYGNVETGVKADTTNSDYIGSNDLIDYQVIGGAGGTSITLRSITILHQVPTVNQSSILKYNILGRISLSRIYKYHVQGRISLSRIYKYHVLSRVTQSKIYKYNILDRVSLSRIYKYHVQGRVSLARTYLYHVVGRISQSRIYKYNILARVSLSRIYKYHVTNLVSLSRTYKYNILGRISLSRIYKYHIQGRVSLARTYLYNIIGRISQSNVYKYNIIGRISLSRIYLYNILGRISLSRIYKYNVAGRISLARIYKYHIIGRVSLAQIYKYHVQSRVSLARTYLWDILEIGLTRISKPQIYLWNINERISLSRVYKYNIIGRISLARTYLYNVIGRISLSRVYKYNLIGRISKSSILKYNVLGRVSLSRIYKWNISDIIRVSKSQIYKWNVITRVSLSQIYKYHVVTRVTLSRIYKYNILSRVSLTRSYLYNVAGRVSLSRIYRWNIIGRITLSRIYKYHVVTRVSLSRTYLWHITNRVSKSVIFKYNVINRISGSKIFKWDVDFQRATREGIITGDTEAKQRYPKQFDRVRSFFYRPVEDKHRRNSRFTRG